MEHPDAAFDLAALPRQFRNALKQEIAPGEVLLWAGRPHPLLFARMTFLNALMGIGIAAVGGTLAAGFVAGYFQHSEVGLLGLALATIGIAMILRPFFVLAKAEQIVYAVTDQRVFSVMFQSKGAHHVEETKIDLEMLSYVERRNGRGDVNFVCRKTMRQIHQEAREQCIKLRLITPSLEGFYGIDTPCDVEALIRQTFSNQNIKKT